MATAATPRRKARLEKTPEARLREKGLRLPTAPVDGFMPGYDWAADATFATLQADMTSREVEYCKARVWRPRKGFAWALAYVVPGMGYDAAKASAYLLERDPRVQSMREHLTEIHGAAVMRGDSPTGPVTMDEILTSLDELFRDAVRAGDTASVLTLSERIIKYRELTREDGERDSYFLPDHELLSEILKQHRNNPTHGIDGV